MPIEGALQPDPTSADLLIHDGLMTVKLMATFGPLFARQSELQDNGDTVRRVSSLHQTASGEKILDAQLLISKPLLPDGMLEELANSTALFGELLLRHGVGIATSEREIYKRSHPLRWGRRQVMKLAGTDDVLCQVDELLVEAATLDALRLRDA